MSLIKLLPFTLAIFGVALPSGDVLAQFSKHDSTYTVKDDDSISKIALSLGSIEFTQAIYHANASFITEPDLIFPGQVLSIPPAVINSELFLYQDTAETTSTAEGEREKQLAQFRVLFNEVIEDENSTTESSEEFNSEPNLELEGLILDETRTKMGRDFYDLFYQNWEPPKNAPNVTITISEQPSMGLGTQVSIKIDYEQVYNARLQPRYEYIEAVSKQAVAHCQSIIQQQASIQNHLNGL